MDMSTPKAVRSSAAAVHLTQMPAVMQTRRAQRALDDAQQKAQADRVSEAYQAGRDAGNVDSWIAGAKVAFLCGLLVGAFAAGVLFRIFVALGHAS